MKKTKNSETKGKGTSAVVLIIILLIFLVAALILFYVGGIKLIEDLISKYLFGPG